MSTDPLGGATAAPACAEQSIAGPEVFSPPADQSIPPDSSSGCGSPSLDGGPAPDGTVTLEEASDSAIAANEEAAECAGGLALVIDGGGTCEAPTEEAAAQETSAEESAPAEEAPAQEAEAAEAAAKALVEAQMQEKLREAIEESNRDKVKEERTSAAKSTKKAEATQRDAGKIPEGFTKVGTLNVGDKFAGLNSSPTRSAARGDIKPEASMSLVVQKIEGAGAEAAVRTAKEGPSLPSEGPAQTSTGPSRIAYGEPITIRNLKPLSESPMSPNVGPGELPGGRGSSPYIPISDRFESASASQARPIGGLSSRTFLFNVYDVHNTLAGQPSVIQVLDKDGNVVREITLTAGAHSQHQIELAEGEYTVVAKSGQVAAASKGKKDEYDNFRVEVLEKKSADKSEPQVVEATAGSQSSDKG